MTLCRLSACLFPLLYLIVLGEAIRRKRSIYPYILTYKDGEFEGDVYEDAPVGSKVAMKGSLSYRGYVPLYLEVEVVRNTKHFDRKLNPSPQSSIEPGENKTQSTAGVKCIIRGTTQFNVDDSGFILVQRSNDSRLRLHSKIYFYVVMVHKEDGAIVSNPLSFIVEIIENPHAGALDKNAITSGILVILIIILALFTAAAVQLRDLLKNKDIKIKTVRKSSVYDIEDVVLGMDWKDHYHIKPEDSIIMEKNETQNEATTNGKIGSPPPLSRMDSQNSTLSWLSLHFDESESSISLSSAQTSSPPRNHGIAYVSHANESKTTHRSESSHTRLPRRHYHKKRRRRGQNTSNLPI